MSDLRVTNLKGRNAGEAPTLPDGVVITGIATVSSVIVGTGITLSSSGINVTGVITASSFSGNGSGLIGVGLGTTGSINTSGIITSTSIVVSAGTTALPSISPTGDTNTGIFFPAADTVAISEGGAEALRVDSSGRLLVGTSSTLLGLTASTLHVKGTQAAVFVGDSGTASNQVLYLQHTNTSGNNLFLEFGTEASLTTRGSIDYNRAAGLVRYNTTSDRRLKSAIQPATSAVDLLSSIQVRSYKWTETDYTVNYGFIAQELNVVLPDAVKQGDDGDEVVDAWAVDNSKVVPLLTKALQEAIAKIETLEQRLTAAGID